MGIIWGFSQDIGRYGMGIGIEIQSPQQPRFYFIYNVLCLRFTQRKYVVRQLFNVEPNLLLSAVRSHLQRPSESPRDLYTAG